MRKYIYIYILTIFFISHKSDVKTFLNGLLTNALKALVSITIFLYIFNDKKKLVLAK